MIQGILNTYAANSYPSSAALQKKDSFFAPEPLNSFDTEDQAIISAEAKLMNELENYNRGKSTETDLAITAITSKIQVKAAARVISTKKDMLDTVLDAMDS